MLIAVSAAATASACSGKDADSGNRPRIRFMHTFQGPEAAASSAAIAEFEAREQVSVAQMPVPFHLAKNAIDKQLDKNSCPDLMRIDATWLPEWSARDKLHVVPRALLAQRDWLPAARELGAIDGTQYGLPQIIDGLAVVYRRAAFAEVGDSWPTRDADQLVAVMNKLAGDGRPRLGLRNAGYWFVPFLRAWGGDLPDPTGGCVNIDTPASLRALERFAALFGSIAPMPSPRGEESKHEAKAFRDGDLAAVVTGPWAVAELTGGDTDGIGVAVLPGAPLGGHLYVVPRCAGDSERAWQLAGFLTRAALQAEWADKLGLLPTATDSLDRADRFVSEFFHALKSARPLPRHPLTSQLFDDLDPALRKLVGGHASAREIQGVLTDAWSRRLSEAGITPKLGCGS